MAGSNPPIFQVFWNGGTPNDPSQTSTITILGLTPGRTDFDGFCESPILRCLRNPHVSSLAYSSSVFAGDERITGWPKKNTWPVELSPFSETHCTFRTTFSFTSRAGSCWEKSSWISKKNHGSVVLHPVKPSEITGKPGDLTSKKWSFHGI
jgi:hypothetical protein